MKSSKVLMNFLVNGEAIEIAVPANRLLIDLLREDLNLTGTKLGCDDGSCGACTILVDGIPSQCCMMLAVSYQGREILTIEGVAKDGRLDPVQQAFCDEGGQQCGFCTPAMVLSARALLDDHPNPSVEDVSEAIAGNLCRCTGYTKIIDAIMKAAKDFQERQNQEPEPERVAI